MLKENINSSLNADLKKENKEQIAVNRVKINAETAEALDEFFALKNHPEKYKRYLSFKDAMEEALSDN